jgi:hypothetical protein
MIKCRGIAEDVTPMRTAFIKAPRHGLDRLCKNPERVFDNCSLRFWGRPGDLKFSQFKRVIHDQSAAFVATQKKLL